MYDDETFKTCEDIANVDNQIRKSGNVLEGNCLYKDSSNFEYFDPGEKYDNKLKLRKNLYKLCEGSRNILEVGLNGGHSACLFYYANPSIELLSFDICRHAYTSMVFDYLKTKYKIELVRGDSRDELPKYMIQKPFDVIHIDGGHGESCAKSDLQNCKRFSHEATVLVFDDSNAPAIHGILEKSIKDGFIKEVDYDAYGLERSTYHRVFNYCFN